MNSLTWLALGTLDLSREPPVYDFFCCPISNRRDQSSSVSRHQRRFTKGDVCVRTQERCGRLRCACGEPFQVGRCRVCTKLGLGVSGGCVWGGSSSRLVGRGTYPVGWKRQAGLWSVYRALAGGHRRSWGHGWQAGGSCWRAGARAEVLSGWCCSERCPAPHWTQAATSQTGTNERQRPLPPSQPPHFWMRMCSRFYAVSARVVACLPAWFLPEGLQPTLLWLPGDVPCSGVGLVLPPHDPSRPRPLFRLLLQVADDSPPSVILQRPLKTHLLREALRVHPSPQGNSLLWTPSSLLLVLAWSTLLLDRAWASHGCVLLGLASEARPVRKAPKCPVLAQQKWTFENQTASLYYYDRSGFKTGPLPKPSHGVLSRAGEQRCWGPAGGHGVVRSLCASGSDPPWEVLLGGKKNSAGVLWIQPHFL